MNNLRSEGSGALPNPNRAPPLAFHFENMNLLQVIFPQIGNNIRLDWNNLNCEWNFESATNYKKKCIKTHGHGLRQFFFIYLHPLVILKNLSQNSNRKWRDLEFPSIQCRQISNRNEKNECRWIPDSSSPVFFNACFGKRGTAINKNKTHINTNTIDYYCSTNERTLHNDILACGI